MQRGQTGILILVGVLLLVVVAGGAYYLGRQTSPKSPSAPVVTSQIPQPTPASSFDVNPAPTGARETANWKIYTSSHANYSFKYPQEWPLVIVPVSTGCNPCIEDIDFTPNYIPNSGDTTLGVIIVNKEPKIQSLDDYVNIQVKGDESKINLNYTTLGGEKAVSYKLSGGIPPLPIIEYVVVKNGYQYILRIEDSKETNKNRDKNIQIFNQILSTFKFQ